MNYEVIKQYYELGLFSTDDLDMFVSIGWLTEKQKKKLLGD